MDSVDISEAEFVDEFRRKFYWDSKFRPLIKAVYSNDLDTFNRLIQDEKASSNYHEYFRYYLLKFLICRGRLEMFKTYVSLDSQSYHYHDEDGRTILMDLPTHKNEGKEEFAKALIAAGANVNDTDCDGDSLLHNAAELRENSGIDNTKLVEIVIENGADINARDDGGYTPLWIACWMKNYSFVHMMLYYGADATIPDNRGGLPLVVLQDKVHQDILFDYTFYEKTTVPLSTLTEAMRLDTDLFNRIVEMTTDVSYDGYMIDRFKIHLKEYIPEHIKLFLKNFPSVVKTLITSIPLLEMLDILFKDCQKTVIDAFLQTTHCVELIQAVRIPQFLILDLIKNLKKEEDVTEIILVLLSYGLEVTSEHLDIVYKRYGFCELFRILLHMDITILEEINLLSFARVYYDLNCDIENVSRKSLLVSRLLEYYNNSKLKEAYLNVNDKKLVDKINMLPNTPCLLELSRNAARKHLVNRYAIKNSRQFYTVLKWLPIAEDYKKILGLERKLY